MVIFVLFRFYSNIIHYNFKKISILPLNQNWYFLDKHHDQIFICDAHIVITRAFQNSFNSMANQAEHDEFHRNVLRISNNKYKAVF